MTAPLNFALIGLGRMGQLYAQALTSQVPGAALVAVADLDPDLRAQTAARYPVRHVLPDGLEACRLPDVDAVLVAAPTSAHHDLVVAAAQAGKAIFCEKPLALTLPENHSAIQAVARAGVPLQVGLMRRFDVAYRRAKDLIDAGKIGRPVTLKSIARDPFCPRVEFADPAKSGGLVVDMGIHDFDVARWLMGDEVTRVSAEGTLQVCETLGSVGDIDNAVVNLRFSRGGIGNVELSRNAFYGYDIRTEILGSEGGINIGSYQQTPVLLLTREGAQHDILTYIMERFGPAYVAQLRHFVECVREGRAPAVTGADALAALEIGVAATRSHQLGRPVELAEVRDM